jgi:hypothetical protein
LRRRRVKAAFAFVAVASSSGPFAANFRMGFVTGFVYVFRVVQRCSTARKIVEGKTHTVREDENPRRWSLFPQRSAARLQHISSRWCVRLPPRHSRARIASRARRRRGIAPPGAFAVGFSARWRH